MTAPAAQLPDWAEPLFTPKRYNVLHGGRGSGKSHTVAAVLLILAARKELRIVCAREFQNSIEQSVKKLLEDKIAELGLTDFYTAQDQVITGMNGSTFHFIGLRNNIASVKSMEGIDILWVEEAQTISQASLDVLIPTIRKSGSVFFFTYNPKKDDDPIHKWVMHDRPDNMFVLEVNWDKNPWFPDELRAEKDRMYATDPEKADHIYGGETERVSEAQVLRGRWVIADFEPAQEWYGPYYGADWGFATDPTVLLRMWIASTTARDGSRRATRTLYIEYEAYGAGVDVEDTPDMFAKVPGSKKHEIYADSARPEMISHMRRNGYPRMLGVPKPTGSVEAGVEHLRSYEIIVIHTRCPNTAREAKAWSYKVDRLSGQVLAELVDKDNHTWDAARYGLYRVIKQGKPSTNAPKEAPKPRDYGSRDESRRERRAHR